MWIRSSFCNTHSCVEMEFRSSSACSNSSCVEAAWAAAVECSCVEVTGHDGWTAASECSTASCVQITDSPECTYVHVRDSKDPNGAQIAFRREDWADGDAVQFQDVPRSVVPLYLRVIADLRGHGTDCAWYRVHGKAEDGSYVSLWFDQGEKDSWLAGVGNREFALTRGPAPREFAIA